MAAFLSVPGALFRIPEPLLNPDCARVEVRPVTLLSLPYPEELSWEREAGRQQDFPVKDGKIVINAWSYQERLGVYKSLLNASAKYFGAFGPQNSGNILWGLPLQHGWQFRTGRLADPSGVTSCGYENGEYLCQSVRSWWSCWHLRAAAYEIEILPPEEQKDDFCYSVKDCWSRMPKSMRAFYRRVQLPATYFIFFSFSLKYLSGPEATFGDDWANGVDFIAATHFRTDLPTTNNFQAFLPPRMLVEQDVIPFISDFSPQQNKVLVSLRALHKANKSTGMSLTYKYKAFLQQMLSLFFSSFHRNFKNTDICLCFPRRI
uniref:Chromosome 6 open reading frame 58 n=1 Tax=Malurus cyaneus samueli TaxID=2593467 RepID=A0A8C5T5J3_9PASS